MPGGDASFRIIVTFCRRNKAFRGRHGYRNIHPRDHTKCAWIIFYKNFFIEIREGSRWSVDRYLRKKRRCRECNNLRNICVYSRYTLCILDVFLRYLVVFEALYVFGYIWGILEVFLRVDLVLRCFPVEFHIGNSMWPYGYQKGGFYEGIA